ncbi:COX10 [Candida oxycetoniae]|uniref:Protoheme IX farnesyltransferase, mitochondrial n=1 Tax=Candida oxycetoniae TaxID=497107 RepID=A0AAI9SWP7_9ASCO|nr:COX10 [Candida oxycetoniae]KAI3404144.2 COX10 [Candida oxycetoniae]
MITPRPKNIGIGNSSVIGNVATKVENVATKVLTCQEPEAKSSQSLTSTSTSTPTSTLTPQAVISPNVPFKVSPKDPRISKAEPVSFIGANADVKSAISAYVKLIKPNLTVLVTLSCICSYAISPLSVSVTELCFLTAGTALCSGAANAINMGREPEFDKQMPRTVGRPVVRGLITPKQAYTFAALIGSTGCTMLWFGVNPVVSMLGFSNIVLYAWIYTSMKRKSILNTWVGAIVGAIPPLMGWAASSSLTYPGAWCLAGLLYAWQFPHFNALSHGIAQQYKSAGYVMAAAENPKLNARVALRYSILMFPLCFGLSYFGVTDWIFPFDSAIANGWMAYWAWKFWQQQQLNYSNSKLASGATQEGLAIAGIHAKKLFWCSVWHLPAVLILAMLHKKDQWSRLYDYVGYKLGKKSAVLD